ncbi:unnamed protein product [Rotaria sp. Silwood2]|nr:unnamed protein product [Rotaria sp. Silwood2]
MGHTNSKLELEELKEQYKRNEQRATKENLILRQDIEKLKNYQVAQEKSVMERQLEQLKKQHAELENRLCQQQINHKEYQDHFIGYMGKILCKLVRATQEEKVLRKEHKQIEIEGIVYSIREYVSRGGFGEIYKGKNTKNHHTVTIKVLANSTVIQSQSNNEIQFLKLVQKIKLDNHPVFEYYGCKMSNDGIYIALELAHCDLYKLWLDMAAKGDFEKKLYFSTMIIMYALRTLIFLEKLNIIYGDIKPQNLVVVQMPDYFCIKLIDFGTIEKLNTTHSQITVTRNKAYTKYFASPEFLQRNPNTKLKTRHLHKKSDA